MPPKGKRRVTQRVRVPKVPDASKSASRRNTSSLQIPQNSKKRRLGLRKSALAVPSNSPNRPGGSSRDTDNDPDAAFSDAAGGSAETISKVRTPPVPRRQLQSTHGSAGGNIRGGVGEQDDEVFRVRRTADTIPEETESDDRDVHVVRREPLEANALYRKYVAFRPEEERQPSNVARRMFSPISPGGCDRTDGPDVPTSGTDCIRTPSVLENREDFDDPNIQVDFDDGIVGLSAIRGILSAFYKDMENKISSEMRSLHSLISDKFRGLDCLESNLMRQLNELRVVSSGGRNNSSVQGRPTPLAKYETKLDLETPHGEWVFSTDVTCKILRVNLCMFIMGLARERGDQLENISLAVRAVLFGLLPSQKREAYSSGVGRQHSSFRFAVVLNSLFNVQHNVLKRFLPLDLSSDGGNAHVVRVSNSGQCPGTDGARKNDLENTFMQIKQPKWLKASFIRKRHVEEARARLESNTVSFDGNSGESMTSGKQKKGWISVKDKPDNGDIARYGALKVYRYITTGLYQAREKARWVLFEELTYLMTIWEEEKVEVDQRTLKLAWSTDCDTEIAISEVPKCLNRKESATKADEENKYTLAQFLSSRKEMVLLVTHDVKVRESRCSARQRRNCDVKVLRRSINLIDVAIKFCVIFTEQSAGGFSHLPFLGAHEDSLRCIYAVALMLRSMIASFMEIFIFGDSFELPEDTTVPVVESHGMRLEHLLPAASVRKRLLASRCLRMTINEYEKLNMTPTHDMGQTSQGSLPQTSTAEEDRIAEDEYGVMFL